MQVPRIYEDHAEHGRRRGEDRREGARRRDRGADDDRRPARPAAPRPQVDRRLQDPRGDADRRDASRCAATAMWEFLDRLVSIALPRIRDFRGLNPSSFDGRGNYSLGIREQIIFPEIDYDDVAAVRGLDVDDHDHRADRRAGPGAPARRSACRSPAKQEGSSSGQEVAGRQGAAAAAVTRCAQYTRCNRCGRPRAVYRKFGLCRICLRELAHQGAIPGMTKSSW